MNNKDFNDLMARDLAEAIAAMWRKMDAIHDLTGWEIYETFSELQVVYHVFIDMVGGVDCDYTFDKFNEYARGKITYETLLIEIQAEVSE